jgi:hypothetical protein
VAVLPDNDRAAVHAELMADLSTAREPLGALTKAELRAAVNAADQWANDNAAAYNAALPLPARTVLTAAQKARLLVYVIRKRWLTGA